MSTAIALVLPVLLLVAWTIERREHAAAHARDLERLMAAHAEQLAAHERERDLSHRDRQMLLNRIKPEAAQYVPGAAQMQTPPAAGFDDDAGYWEAVGSIPTETLADMVMRHELAERDVSS